MVLTTKDIRITQDEIFNHCKAQAVKKGNDYSGASEDTFMNLRLVKEFKLTDNDMKTVLAECVKKISRMSNFSQPGFTSQVKDESAFDTVTDLVNYATYWLMFNREAKGLKPNEKWTKEDEKVFQRYFNAKHKHEIEQYKKALNKKKKPRTSKRKTSAKTKPRKAAKKRVVKDYHIDDTMVR